MATIVQSNTVFKLIRNACTLHAAKEFLKLKNLTFSAGTWKELFDKRMMPALKVGTLTLAQVHGLLRESEEHGRQHVFLFKCEPNRAALMLSPSRIKSITKEQGLEEIADSPLAIQLPSQPQIVDLRWEKCSYDGSVSATFLIKQVETRVNYEFAGQATDPVTGAMTKRYETVKSRAVNLARLHIDGMLEVRLASHRNSTQYADTLRAFINDISPWFLKDDFNEISLDQAKSAILDRRAELSEQIRHGGHTLRNDSGTTLTAKASSSRDNILDDGAAETSLDSFLGDDGWSESSQIYFKIGSKEDKRDVSVLLSGASNEFALPLKCTHEDYEYVFEQIRTLNS